MRAVPLSVPSDQLLCLPEPFMPLKGFSWSSTLKPWARATLRMSDIMSMLWSTARLHSSYIGGKLKLVRCHLVVACLHRYSQFESLYLEVFHERGDTYRDGAEVMILELLVASTLMPHERSFR